MLTLTRRYHFSAGHRLRRADWDMETNSKVYGRCANPGGHGHNYYLFVSVSGEQDSKTGMIVDLSVLDSVVKQQILDKLDHRFLNTEIEFFHTAAPTSEQLCRFIWKQLKSSLKTIRLTRIVLNETENNSFEYSE